MNISLPDSNMAVPGKINKDDIAFYKVKEAPFRIYGVEREEGKFRRIPLKVAQSVSPAVVDLHVQTAGGRVRFVTDSAYVAIHVSLCSTGSMPHMPHTGVAGFDLYGDWSHWADANGRAPYKGPVPARYLGTFKPPFGATGEYESIIEPGERKERVMTLNFPLYSGVKELYIGLQKDASLKPAPDYTVEKPMVSYGSSITQGGCASRPGNSYQAILSRRFDCDYLNLGFSGNARGEEAIGDYIAGLKMSVFLMDYDYNAPTPEHLERTHERLYRQVRSAQPNLPIIIMSAPKYYLDDDRSRRLEIIRATYHNALAAGDRNVYLLEGPQLMALAGDNGTVDGVHPNDLGFYSMAAALEQMLRSFTS